MQQENFTLYDVSILSTFTKFIKNIYFLHQKLPVEFFHVEFFQLLKIFIAILKANCGIIDSQFSKIIKIQFCIILHKYYI